MKPDYEVLELQLRGTAQLLAEERRNHAATAQALSDAEIGGRNAFVMAAAGHLVCLEWLAGIRPNGKPGHLAFNALLAAHDATTPSPEQKYVVVEKERLARLEDARPEGEHACTTCDGFGTVMGAGYYVPGEQFCEPPGEERCEDCIGSGQREVQMELKRLRAIETAAREWTAARVEDGRMLGHSVIPTAQRLLDALGDS